MRNENSSETAAVGRRAPRLASFNGVQQQAARLLNDFAGLSSEYFWEMDANFRYCFLSDNFTNVTGIPVQLALRMTDKELGLAEDFPSASSQYFDALFSCLSFRNANLSIMHPNGRDIVLRINANAILDKDGDFSGYRGSAAEIGYAPQLNDDTGATRPLANDYADARAEIRTTDLQNTNSNLLETQSRLKEATRIAKLGYFRWNSTTNHGIYRDEELARILGTSTIDCRAETTEAFLQRIHPDDRNRVAAEYTAGRTQGARQDIEYRIVRPDGEIRHIHERSTPVLRQDGTVLETFGTMQDISEREAIAEELAKVEERLVELGTAAREVLYVLSADWSEVIYVSKAFEAIWGHSCESVIDNPKLWIDSLHPSDKGKIFSEIENKMNGSDTSPDFSDARVVGADGEIRWLSTRVYPVRDKNGVVVRLAGVAEDITERKIATDVLHHAQKMDALGQLTGGVAHDFNNLLAVILGNAELLLSERTENDSEILEDILSAGRRAAELTKRLLAFSRLQPMQPKPVDVGALITSLSGLLQRTLGMSIAVEITSVSEGSLVIVDPSLLENAVLNLALNSRDAMPEGGSLRIFVSSPQDRCGIDCVEITVHDDGIGMEQAELSRALEPFFTTKKIGEGSGLGLSMVYGFVKQSNGDLVIDSKFGVGTTVSIFLPYDNEQKQ